MMFSRYRLFIILQFLPCYAFAHGEEALITLFLPIVPGIVFLIVLNFLQLRSNNKKVLLGIYALALFLSFFITRNWPHSDNLKMINLLVTFLAPISAFIAYFFVRRKEKAFRHRQVDTFLIDDRSVDASTKNKQA